MIVRVCSVHCSPAVWWQSQWRSLPRGCPMSPQQSLLSVLWWSHWQEATSYLQTDRETSKSWFHHLWYEANESGCRNDHQNDRKPNSVAWLMVSAESAVNDVIDDRSTKQCHSVSRLVSVYDVDQSKAKSVSRFIHLKLNEAIICSMRPEFSPLYWLLHRCRVKPYIHACATQGLTSEWLEVKYFSLRITQLTQTHLHYLHMNSLVCL